MPHFVFLLLRFLKWRTRERANCQGLGSPFHSIWLPCFGKMRQIFTVFRGLGLVIFAVDSEAGGSPIAPQCTPWRPRLVADQQRANRPSRTFISPHQAGWGPGGAQEMDGRESTWPPGTRRRGEMPCIGLACRCG
ncbi:hypothetical protein GE21DRAFT_1210899 [Neurospora crassa]|nr:hypothetical protein B24H17.200 [imported] - Neurospora crassa [Neurospora crassa]KHE83547.1 hypothetical protein GE21DRAFT_1210899 [Neurospora crassa]